MYITPNQSGHRPAGYPVGGGALNSFVPEELEQATDKPDLQAFRSVIENTLGSGLASDYFRRNIYTRDWWYARWPYQTVDGRKWGDARDGVEPWPWPGASDTRIRTVEKMIGQHRTLATFAVRNMKVQAKSTRPLNTMRESQQATTLLNWMLFTHMQAEMHRELRLGISWRNGKGAAILKADWKQTRQMNYIDVNVLGLQEFINEPAVKSFIGSGVNIPIGENLDILDLQQMIMDPAYAEDLASLLRSVSHDYLTLRAARKKLDDLRQLRTVEIPVPYVFESRPRITALQPMVDIVFPTYADDLQRVPWTDCIEYVNATELRDRVKTAGYDQKFVDAALQFRGPSMSQDWRTMGGTARAEYSGVGQSLDNDIELHHFYTLVHDRGVPVRFCTVFHMDVEIPGKHEPYGYEHGDACFHPLRFEIDERPILSSRGIAEIAYTWEQELKAQFDANVDRTALSLRPPIITTYDQVQKLKENVQPGVVFPMRKFDDYEFMKMPPWDQVSMLVAQAVDQRVKEHFAIFGLGAEFTDLMKLRREEFVDDMLAELKPVKRQIMQLMRQLLPDDEVAQVVGPLNRPFHIGREEIQQEFEISATVDLRNVDAEWVKEKGTIAAQILALDTTGVTNKAAVVRSLWEGLDYSFADIAVQDTGAATNAEIQDEQRAIDLIIGSAQDQSLPQGANYQLRLQTLQAKQQDIQNNPGTMRIIQNNPEILKVLLNRATYFQRQLQQQENGMIGKMQVTKTFTKQAPSVQEESEQSQY